MMIIPAGRLCLSLKKHNIFKYERCVIAKLYCELYCTRRERNDQPARHLLVSMVPPFPKLSRIYICRQINARRVPRVAGFVYEAPFDTRDVNMP